MRFFWVLLLSFFGLIITLFIGYKSFLKPLDKNFSGQKTFVINSGESLGVIASRLEKNYFIRNRYAFIFQSYLLGLNRKLQAGTFRLSPKQSVAEIIKTLSSRGSTDIWIRIPEGSRNLEIAKYLSKNTTFSPEEFLIKAKEGYIFPDSYSVPDFYTLNEFLTLVEKNFTQKVGINLPIQTLILASLLEREGYSLEDKKVIAGILLNRLRLGMALQVDATVQYARDSKRPSPEKFWLPISKSDLKINSIYNTYLLPGLPPSPICNPSLTSIHAALNPTTSDFLFYIHDLQGQPHYAKNLSQHTANIKKYLKSND